MDLHQLIEDFEAVAHDTSMSNASFFGQHLLELFDILDESPGLKAVVDPIEKNVDFDAWYSSQGKDEGSAFGSLKWPRGRKERLGIQIALFRAMAEGRVEPESFASTFISTSPRYDDMIAELCQQVFIPMASELSRRFKRITSASVDVPASDRTVAIDHNSTDYQTAVHDLETLETAISEANDYPDLDDQDQRVAEVGAMRRLLAARRVRVDAFVALVERGLRYFASKFADKAMGALAVALIAVLGRLTGLW